MMTAVQPAAAVSLPCVQLSCQFSFVLVLVDCINEGAHLVVAIYLLLLPLSLALQLTDLVLRSSNVSLSASQPDRCEDQSHRIDIRYTAGLLF